MPTLEKATTELIASYHELNGGVDELCEASISPLDFMRYVCKNRPFVLRGGCSEWPAVRKWNSSYFKEAMGDSLVKIAITPQGNADSVVKHPENGVAYFVNPFEKVQPFHEFLDYLHHYKNGDVIKYSQAQNDNLRGEYSPLYRDVEADIRWASIALGQEGPDAINLWIGNSQSTTALHRDNYENIYCQIMGVKDFVIMPPIETACVNEQCLPGATYNSSLEIVPDSPPSKVPCALWDPDEPTENTTRYSSLSRPLRVTLNPGDMFYLPATWYHKVSQHELAEKMCCSVNYWYDMDYEGGFCATNTFVRHVAWAATGADGPESQSHKS